MTPRRRDTDTTTTDRRRAGRHRSTASPDADPVTVVRTIEPIGPRPGLERAPDARPSPPPAEHRWVTEWS